MFEIIFYRDKNGDSQIQDTLEDLRIKSKTDKEALVDFAKITLYITLLSEYGLSLNSNFIKHLDHEIWELRPRKNRILFFGYNHNKFVLLHSFIKSTQKTPKKEILQARKEMELFITQENNNEKL